MANWNWAIEMFKYSDWYEDFKVADKWHKDGYYYFMDWQSNIITVTPSGDVIIGYEKP